jgi:thiamine biosynthesis lipoprotein
MIYRIDFKAMGCRMIAMLDSSLPNAPQLLQQVPVWFEDWEQALSRFRTDSELNRLNASAGWPIQVSETLWDVFQAAAEAEATSGGLVRATVLDALEAAGYNRSFDQLPRDQVAAPVSGWEPVGSLAEVDIDESIHTICLPTDIRLDFGGVAKGWAAHQASKRLAGYGPSLVSAGGDIAISSEQSDGQKWPVAIDNPFQNGDFIDTLMLGACGVATSGTDYRHWKQGGRLSHHIIDPRSGRPAQTDLISATVIAPNAMTAEMAAKTALILGSENALEWIGARPELAVLLVLETGEILYGNHLGQFLWSSHERKTS